MTDSQGGDDANACASLSKIQGESLIENGFGDGTRTDIEKRARIHANLIRDYFRKTGAMPTCRYLYRVTASQVCGRMSTQILSKRSVARFDVLGLPTQVAVEQLRSPGLGRNRVASGCL